MASAWQPPSSPFLPSAPPRNAPTHDSHRQPKALLRAVTPPRRQSDPHRRRDFQLADRSQADVSLKPRRITPKRPGELKDARIMWVADRREWIISYTSFSPIGPLVSLASTVGFKTLVRLGAGDAARGQRRRDLSPPVRRPLRDDPQAGVGGQLRGPHLAVVLPRPAALGGSLLTTRRWEARHRPGCRGPGGPRGQSNRRQPESSRRPSPPPPRRGDRPRIHRR